MENASVNEKASTSDPVEVSDWVACYNSTDESIVLSCTLTAAGKGSSISGVGVILNTSAGKILASTYCAMSSPSQTVYPALNLARGSLKVGEGVLAIAQGESNGNHFFFEERLTISKC